MGRFIKLDHIHIKKCPVQRSDSVSVHRTVAFVRPLPDKLDKISLMPPTA